MEKFSALEEKVRSTGEIRMEVKHPDGSIDRYLVKNLVLAAGLQRYAERAIDNAALPGAYMAVGTGTVAAAPGDLTLGAEIAGSRVAVTSSTTGNTVTYVAVFPPGAGTGPLTEAGLFDAATAGTMLCRSVFGVKTKDALDQITMTWKNTFVSA